MDMEEKNFSSRIKTLRKERNISQKELAKVLGVNEDTISVWERGLRTPSRFMLERLAYLFSVDKDYLLGESNERYSKTVLPNEWASSDEKDNDEYFSNMMSCLSKEGKLRVYDFIKAIYLADKESDKIDYPDY